MSDCIPLVFHRQENGYGYRLESDAWTLSASEACILSLESTLGEAGFYIEYRH